MRLHARYWFSHFHRHRSGLIVSWLLEPLVNRLGSRASFEGIEIVAPPVRKGEAEPPFLRHVADALRLIRSVDPRRFRRVQREIAVIKDAPSLSFASYGRVTRCCCIDHARTDPDKLKQNPEWYRWVYATVLVHEATHGAVDSRYVQYTPELRARIEQLCCAEARRFATRADREGRRWSDALVPAFDETRWHESWHATRWQKSRKLSARYWEVAQNGKAKK